MRLGLGIGLDIANKGGGEAAIAPANTVAPAISGTTSLGSTLTSTTGTWTGTAPITYSYQWKRGATNIGTNSSTYVTVVGDSLANITCVVTATNIAGSANATSNTLTMANYTPANTVAPAVSGTAVVGQVLTTTNGTWSNSPSSYSYQWKRGATNIGTNASTYTLVAADAGNTSNIKCTVTATNGLSASADSNTVAQILTVRTNSFLTASTITDATIKGALNTLDIGLISNSLDTKIVALYPMVGGTASTHKWNFMDARDLDVAFRVTFSGTWTHSSSGAKPNGTNAYARTYCVPSSTARSAYGVYTTEQVDSGVKVVMAQSAAAGGYMSPSLSVLGVRGSGTLTGYPNTTKGMILGYDIDTSTSYYANINGTGQTVTRVFAAFNANDYYLGAFTAASYFSGNNLALAFVGGLSNQTEASNLRTLVQAFQTTLSRNV